MGEDDLGKQTAIALTIAGSDSGGGAGIQADLKSFSALGVYGASVLTAITAQNTRAVTGVEPVSPAMIRAQIDAVLDDLAVGAVKIGMLGTAEVARAVADGLSAPIASGELHHRVLDPVMVAKSGDSLLEQSAVRMLVEAVVPLATVITPNLPEAGVLLGGRAPDNVAEMRRAAERLRRLMADDGERWVLVKGGHLPGDAVDVLHDGDRMLELPSPRIQTRNSHGTGCTLSAAIAALLPQSPDVATAVRRAKRYLDGALGAADSLAIGRTAEGHGPVHHFYHWWAR